MTNGIEAAEGRRRVVVEGVAPEVDGGRFPIKREVGGDVTVEADAFGDGHDRIRVVLRYRHADDATWSETPMEELGNDRWRATFPVMELGRYRYAVEGWVDRFGTWRQDLEKRIAAGQDVSVDLLIGADLVAEAATRAAREVAERLEALATELRGEGSVAARSRSALAPENVILVAAHPDRSLSTSYDRELEVVVDPVRARFSSWYELFPRSASPEPGRHGTFRDVIARLAYVEELGFDILYLPPIHPIGRTYRKGPNNVAASGPADPGVPWAIGGPEGGHTAVHPELGTLDDFRALVSAAGDRGIAIALDVAFQASPDHPWVKEHPTWFRARPDGTIQYAENPPKRYQDIYPFDFESDDWRSLWRALRDVFLFWIGEGVTAFRVDNPHTKSFAFWAWCIAAIKERHPETLFLAEAFTRPKVMHRLAKVGFSQSYTYFTWRNTKDELGDYLVEVASGPGREYFRPNFWPNTPDILHEVLQQGGTPIFESRLVLAAAMTANYGIYGPAFELGERVPREPGSEEYLDSEKYQIRHWDLERPGGLRGLVTRVNTARRAHPALQANDNVRLHDVDNDRILCWSKRTADRSDVVLAVVSLDPHQPQGGTVTLALDELGGDADAPFEVVDLLTDTTYVWEGERNHVVLGPDRQMAHLFHVRPRLTGGPSIGHHQ